MRFTKKDLEAQEEQVNALLDKINLKVAYRYSYTAIDITDKQGEVLDTLVAGLTKSEAHRLLYCIKTVLAKEKHK